jgi:TonB family protein
VSRATVLGWAALAAAGCLVAPGASAQGLAAPKEGLSAPAAADAWRPTLVRGTCVRPEYPLASMRAQEAGTSVIGLTVDVAGAVSGTQVLKSSGSARLDRAAADALSACRFKPAHDSMGTPVASTYSMRFEWRLADAPPDPWVALRALNGAGFAPTDDFAAVPFAGDSAATPQQRAKMLQAARAEALDKAQCASIEQASARAAADDPTPDHRSLELWTLTQCGQPMRYVVVLMFPEARRPSFRMVPLAPSQADPFTVR